MEIFTAKYLLRHPIESRLMIVTFIIITIYHSVEYAAQQLISG